MLARERRIFYQNRYAPRKLVSNIIVQQALHAAVIEIRNSKRSCMVNLYWILVLDVPQTRKSKALVYLLYFVFHGESSIDHPGLWSYWSTACNGFIKVCHWVLKQWSSATQSSWWELITSMAGKWVIIYNLTLAHWHTFLPLSKSNSIPIPSRLQLHSSPVLLRLSYKQILTNLSIASNPGLTSQTSFDTWKKI